MPHFTKDPAAAPKPINARAESVASSSMFRGAFGARRCLVPASAFYEWQVTPGGKQPYAIARADGSPLAFGGLWEGWRAPDGAVLRSFTIITTQANATMRSLHDRMPLVLESADWPLWLGEVAGAPAPLLKPAHDDLLRAWPVSSAINNVKNDGAELLAPIAGAPDPTRQGKSSI